MQSEAKSQLLAWTIRYPLDRWYRKKYNVPYGSKQHRELCQIDVYMEYLEDVMFDEYYKEAVTELEREKEFEKGIWIRERSLSEEDSMAAFDNIDISQIPDMSNIQIED